ncbi:hypothetical protein ACGFNV_15875 [Streptomyces sp. NPDC048751]|uniref:hypothetical protein n=1 Tax=Streptomyces sp. NPDC048751 TaxID=3365591 RepID=UPI00371045C8
MAVVLPEVVVGTGPDGVSRAEGAEAEGDAEDDGRVCSVHAVTVSSKAAADIKARRTIQPGRGSE